MTLKTGESQAGYDKIALGMTRRQWIWLFALVIFYLASRLVDLNQLPPFIDEALHVEYTRQIQSGFYGAGTNVGKWLSIVIMTPFTLLPVEPVLALRFVSLISGLLTMAAVLLTGRELFSARVGLAGVAFYLLMPYVLFYNRLGLTDGILAAFGAWILLVSIQTIRASRGGLSVLLAILLMASFLAKASGLIFVALPLLAVIILLPPGRWLQGMRKIGPAMLGSLAIILLLYFTGVGFRQIGRKTGESTAGLDWQLASRNIKQFGRWFWLLLTPLAAIYAFLSLLWALFIARQRALWLLLAVFAVSVLPYIFFASVWYPRYLLFSLVPLALVMAVSTTRILDWLAATGLPKLAVLIVSSLLLIGLLSGPLVSGYRMVFSPESVSFPAKIRNQYISGWTAGYGSRELTAHLAEMAGDTEEQLLVLRPVFWTHTNRGGLDLYRQGDENMTLVDMGLNLTAEIEAAKEQLRAGRPAVFVLDSLHPQSVNLFELIRPYFQVERIWYNMKPGASGGLEIWEVTVPLDEAG